MLDLFCGAGGASVGYARAGFEVVGIDHEPQPRFPFRFIQADALAPPLDLWEFDLIHASPPCQAYSRATAWRGDRNSHPDLIATTRRMLESSGAPYVIENVQEARFHLDHPVMLCGSHFGLKVRRHRYFEVPSLSLLTVPPPCEHRPGDIPFDHGGTRPESEYRDAMGCEWMTVTESREAIPPAYTEWIGRRLLTKNGGAAA